MEFNNAFFDELGRSPAVEKLVTDVALAIAVDAQLSAPRDTGAYADGIKVQVKHQKRVVAVVIATDPKSMIIESKTGNLVRALNRKKRSRG